MGVHSARTKCNNLVLITQRVQTSASAPPTVSMKACVSTLGAWEFALGFPQRFSPTSLPPVTIETASSGVKRGMWHIKTTPTVVGDASARTLARASRRT